MSSDRLREFLDAHRAATPSAAPEEFAHIMRRARAADAVTHGGSRRGRIIAGTAVAFCSFLLTFGWIQQGSQSPPSPGMSVRIAATPSPREGLDREVSDFFDETSRALEGDVDGWGWDEEILL